MALTAFGAGRGGRFAAIAILCGLLALAFGGWTGVI
jgi:hypothetical protein